MRRGIRIVAVSALAAMLGAGAAAAAGKERVRVESFTDDYAFAVDCGEFGDHEFANEVEGTMRVRVTDVLARDGELLQTVIHVVFRETGTNSVTGRSLPLRGAVHEVWDYASNSRTISGAVFMGTAPGGTYVHDTGRITMGLDDRVASFVAGPHEAFFAGGVDVLVCDALAG